MFMITNQQEHTANLKNENGVYKSTKQYENT